MARLSQEEIDHISREYLNLKSAAENGTDKERKKFKFFQNYCVEKFKYLVQIRSAKYRRFSNHPDLEQDGYEALILAFNTFNPDKGSFSWWADKYISTRISRAANAHSTIRFPIKKAKEMRPYKTNSFPTMVDTKADPFFDTVKSDNKSKIQKAISSLPNEHKRIINMTYGFNGVRERPIGFVLEHLSISRQQYLKLLKEAKEQLRQHLSSVR